MLNLWVVIARLKLIKMDMKLRKELREFIKWQIRKDMLKNELTIDYEVAEAYLEQEKQGQALPIDSVSNSACKYYVSGVDTAMNCINCDKPKMMHDC